MPARSAVRPRATLAALLRRGNYQVADEAELLFALASRDIVLLKPGRVYYIEPVSIEINAPFVEGNGAEIIFAYEGIAHIVASSNVRNLNLFNCSLNIEAGADVILSGIRFSGTTPDDCYVLVKADGSVRAFGLLGDGGTDGFRVLDGGKAAVVGCDMQSYIHFGSGQLTVAGSFGTVT